MSLLPVTAHNQLLSQLLSSYQLSISLQNKKKVSTACERPSNKHALPSNQPNVDLQYGSYSLTTPVPKNCAAKNNSDIHT